MKWQRVDIGDVIWVIKGENAVARIDHEIFYGWILRTRTILSDNWKVIAFFQERDGYSDPAFGSSVESREWEESEMFAKAEEIAEALGYI